MVITKELLQKMLLSAASAMAKQEEYLCEIDSKFGDGDHGLTIAKIAKLLQEKVPQWKNESMAEFLGDIGMEIMEVRGGSAGPLYGTLIGGLGAQLTGEDEELDGEGAKRMLAGALAEMQDITTAKIGDKTMMDALIPGVKAAQESTGEADAIWRAAAKAAQDGAKASEQFVAKFGRAKSYKEETIGTPDAGAVSTSLFITGMAEGMTK